MICLYDIVYVLGQLDALLGSGSAVISLSSSQNHMLTWELASSAEEFIVLARDTPAVISISQKVRVLFTCAHDNDGFAGAELGAWSCERSQRYHVQ